MGSTSPELPVIVIGAGPIGLAAGAHLSARDVPFVVVEQGDRPAASVRTWGHVRLFSSWAELIDPAARLLLAPRGWIAPDSQRHPTGHEWVKAYLEPLAAALADSVRLNSTVTAVSRQGRDLLSDGGRDDAPFVVRVDTPAGPERLLGRAVIDASGTIGTPSPLGADGLPTPNERMAAAAITAGVPDIGQAAVRNTLAGTHVVVVGRGHTAQNALLAVAEQRFDADRTRVTWLLRGTADSRTFGGGGEDQNAARGAIGTRVRALVSAGLIEVVQQFRITDVVPDGPPGGRHGAVLHAEDGRTLAADHVIQATGYRPDLSLLAELRLDLDPAIQAPRALGPLIDPNIHSCGTVPPHGQAELAHPEKDLYVVGMKSYGRAPTFLALTGYEQVRSITAHLAGDLDAARDVRLALPETGVCGAPDRTEADLISQVAGISPLPAVDVGMSACC